VVGVHLSTDAVRVACVEHAGSRPEAVALDRVGIDASPARGLGAREISMAASNEAASLRGLLERLAPGAGRCVVSVSGPDVLLRSVVVPDGGDAADAIHRIREQMVHDPDSVITGHALQVPLRGVAAGAARRAMVVVARRAAVEARLSWVRAAGGVPEAVEVEALALHNVFALAHPEALDGSIALLWVGPTSSCVNLMDDGLLRQTRELSVGLASMNSDEGLEPLHRLLRPSHADPHSRAPGQLFVAGPGACDPMFVDQLGERTRIETRAIGLHRAFVLGPALARESGFDLCLPEYAVALGLALNCP
jgi:Tfp pilus assembly PilM family ATPase